MNTGAALGCLLRVGKMPRHCCASPEMLRQRFFERGGGGGGGGDDSDTFFSDFRIFSKDYDNGVGVLSPST